MQSMSLDAHVLRRRRWGCIVTSGGALEAVHGRWWPHLGSLAQVLWDVHFRRGIASDRCELYYHQSISAPGFLTLSYIRSGARTTLSSLYAATLALDEVARLRKAHAIVCHVTNDRISDRLLLRWGWEAHCPNLAGRHFIKRFYGVYPAIKPYWRKRLRIDNQSELDSGSASQALPDWCSQASPTSLVDFSSVSGSELQERVTTQSTV